LDMGLTDIKGLGEATEQDLKDKGIETLEELAKADVGDLPLGEKKAKRFVDRAKQKTVIIQSGEEAEEEFADRGYISTGIDLLDEALGGGWEESMLAAIYGPSGYGKTQLAFSSVLEATKNGRAVYIETERGNYRPERLKQLAEGSADQAKVDRIKAFHNLDEQYAAYEAVQDAYGDELQLVVIDSFTSQFRGAEEFQGRNNLGDRADAIRDHLQAIGELLDIKNIPVVITGQIYEEPEMFGNIQMWGSTLLEHEVGYFVQMANGEGNLVKATVENHPGKPKKSISLNIHELGIEGKVEE